ncbi:S8 family serine peptidase [Rhizobium lentis]|uniref:S8 family serine peptidase n=1 Tax=Rhizobium lentis TaxID=1138194 RepID=UPI001C82E7CC|nr:S8 family serine peptidase [Rhizobium lentis]MBX5000946.1 S8 family serine peptidase [Rhizobium lentis]MBX5020362.1 S8 family serine peptidase [Rhizobium lentis]
MLKQYIVLPAHGFRSPVLAQAAALRLTIPFAAAAGGTAALTREAMSKVEVVDSVSVDGPKLVEMTPETELELRLEEPALKIVPLITYEKMRAIYKVKRAAAAAAVAQPGQGAVLRVEDTDGNSLSGARVVAFTNFRTRAGDDGSTDANGEIRLRIAPGVKLERIYVYGPACHWGRFERNFTLAAGAIVQLETIDLSNQLLALRRFRDVLPATAGDGVVVGIVDTGIDPNHPLLPNISGGANMVLEETKDDPGEIADWGPAAVEGEHGTHVAGIVGARPTVDIDLAGVAPGVTLRSYRVFPHNGGDATNYDIMNAIDRAVQDGCNIINLSLGGGEEDEAIRAAIGSALDSGVLVIAAAGNDGRKPVSYPAALPFCIAVTAMGWTNSFPAASSEAGDVARPYGGGNTFVGAFSNFGPQIDLTGPGVGVVSTLPGGTFGAMSGTSMASPALAGYAAYLLGQDATILGLNGAEKSTALRDKLFGSATPLGFGRDFEGFGLPG